MLTPKETEVTELAAWGMCNKEIAQRMSVELVTTKLHLRQAMKKLKCKNRVELALCWHGLIIKGSRED